MANNVTQSSTPKTRVGLAIQGGVIPAGAFAAGVLKGLVDKGAFNTYDICAFSGTSAGAAVATVCWGNKLNNTINNIKDDLERQWMYLAWPNHLAWLPIWTPEWAAGWLEFDAFWMKFPMWRSFVEWVRTPFISWIMKRWFEDIIPIGTLNTRLGSYTNKNRADRPGLVLGSAEVLRGEIKTFREDELSLSTLRASGSLDEINGTTTITAPHHLAGIYLDGAWADNPPIGELMDYRLHEIWFIQCFPKEISALPHTPAGRKERRDELWQNSLVEHELEFVELINYWRDHLNNAILAEITLLQGQGKLPGTSPNDPNLTEHLQKLHKKNGKLPQKPIDLPRLFDESNNFQPKHYEKVEVKTIKMEIPRELGSAFVNAPWFIRNMIDHGYERACDFANRNFGSIKPIGRAGPRPGWWACIPSPINDFFCSVYPSRPATDALELVCDFCPWKCATTACEPLLDVLPKGARGAVVKADQFIHDVCLKTQASGALGARPTVPMCVPV